jgi:hypothetical protein
MCCQESCYSYHKGACRPLSSARKNESNKARRTAGIASQFQHGTMMKPSVELAPWTGRIVELAEKVLSGNVWLCRLLSG